MAGKIPKNPFDETWIFEWIEKMVKGESRATREFHDYYRDMMEGYFVLVAAKTQAFLVEHGKDQCDDVLYHLFSTILLQLRIDRFDYGALKPLLTAIAYSGRDKKLKEVTKTIMKAAGYLD